MLVKCKCHGEKKDRDLLYKITINNKNEYYCSESEYLKIKEERESKVEVFNLINEIFGYIVVNTAIFKELSEITKVHTYVKILSYIQNNKESLVKFMNKNFGNEYGKIRYFTTILKNNIQDFKIPKQEVIKQNNIEILNSKYKYVQRKKSINEYLDEME